MTRKEGRKEGRKDGTDEELKTEREMTTAVKDRDIRLGVT